MTVHDFGRTFFISSPNVLGTRLRTIHVLQSISYRILSFITDFHRTYNGQFQNTHAPDTQTIKISINNANVKAVANKYIMDKIKYV